MRRGGVLPLIVILMNMNCVFCRIIYDTGARPAHFSSADCKNHKKNCTMSKEKHTFKSPLLLTTGLRESLSFILPAARSLLDRPHPRPYRPRLERHRSISTAPPPFPRPPPMSMVKTHTVTSPVVDCVSDHLPGGGELSQTTSVHTKHTFKSPQVDHTPDHGPPR